MENVIFHNFTSDEIFFVYPQGEEGKFFPDMVIKVSSNQEAYFTEDKKVIKNLRIGTNSPVQSFTGSVVFIKKEDLELKWGTLEPIPFKDKDLSLIYIKAYGKVILSIEDCKKFIEKLIKEKDFYLTEEFIDFLRNLIFYEFSSILKENLVQLNKKELEDKISKNLNLKIENIGLKIKDFNIIGGNFLEEEELEEKKEKGNFCKNCKKEIPIEANFCPYCGEKISNKCPFCKKEVPEFAFFCPFCGKKLN